MRTGGDALVAQLAHEGVDTVFGVPGLQIYGFIDALSRADPPIRFVVARHEQAAAYMADGYARVGAGVGVFTVVPGPGVLNTFAAIATASAAGSPLLAIVGQVPTSAQGKGTGVLHDVPEQSQLLDALTGWRRAARTTAEIPLLVHEALEHLRRAPHTPAAIEVAPDVMLAEFIGGPVHASAIERRPEPTADTVGRVLAMLGSARAPVLYVGGGMRSQWGSDAVRAAADVLGLPVVMSQNGLGTLDGHHPLAASPLDGRTLLAEADLVLAIGTRFVTQGRQIQIAAEADLVLVNVDVDDLREPRAPDLAVRADGAAFLDALAAAAEAAGFAAIDPADRLRLARSASRDRLADVAPQTAWLSAIEEAVRGEDAILVTDFTQVGYVTPIAWHYSDWISNVAPGYQGNLGYAYAAALGAAVGRPGRPVVAIVGDGGFGWTLAELATAHQFGIPVIAIVFDDSAFGNVARDQTTQFDGRVFGSALTNPDFVLLAEAFHVSGSRATTHAELTASIRGALDAGGPAVIHVPVGSFPDPWHLLL
jgi:acetolactate synthase-1/2/3 large subunit